MINKNGMISIGLIVLNGNYVYCFRPVDCSLLFYEIGAVIVYLALLLHTFYDEELKKDSAQHRRRCLQLGAHLAFIFTAIGLYLDKITTAENSCLCYGGDMKLILFLTSIFLGLAIPFVVLQPPKTAANPNEAPPQK